MIEREISSRRSLASTMSGPGVPAVAGAWFTAIVTVILMRETDTFNLDLPSARVFRGPEGSYFGYSVSLHNNSHGFRVLVGAPKAPSEYEPDVTTPGALYDCPLSGSTNCSQVAVDISGNSQGGKGYNRYEDHKDHQWLGVALDSRRQGNGNAVVCGHRWVNTRRNTHFSNGICYELNGDLELRSSRKLLPLVNSHKQVKMTYSASYQLQLDHSNYAFGQAGASVHYTKNGETLLVGAPGVYAWKGAVIQYVNTGVPYVLTTPTTVPMNSYAGYSVTSGYFFRDRRLYYVSSAPRLNSVGKVFIFTGRFDIRLEFQGSQIGSYFGTSLCAVDLNGDGYEELLVGAPLFRGHRGDEGAVFVYINRLKGLLSPTPEPLMGSHAAWSRFGSAITSAGDIDGDGLNDVIVGAPYEDDGSGAVYIYNGAHYGINMEYSQRLTPHDLGLSMRGFGGALSSDLDIDDNGYPDVAVGAYGTDSVVALFSRPVIYMEARIAIHHRMPHINLQRFTCTVRDSLAPCLALYVVFGYTSKGPETMRVEYVLSADVLLTDQFLLPRGRIVLGNRLVSRVSNVTTLTRNESWQMRYLVAFDANEKDLLTPVQFHLSYRLLDEPGDNPSSLTPILHAYQEREQFASVNFLRNCGSDNLCESDLDLNVQIVSPTNHLEVVHGHKAPLYIVCELVNRGEPAYLTEIHIQYQDTVKFVRVNKSDHDGHIVCIPLVGNYDSESDHPGRSTLLCEVGHAIGQGQMVNFTLALDTSYVEIDEGFVEITIEARTGGAVEETGRPHNSPEVISIPVVTRNNLVVSGKSIPEQYEFNTKIYDNNDTSDDLIPAIHRLIHYYDILNSGPGALPYANLSLAIPSIISNGEEIIVVDSVDLLADGQSITAAGNCRHVTSDAIRTRNRTPSLTTSLLKLLQNDNTDDPISVSCQDTECQEYECEIGSMGPGDSLLLQVHLLLDLKAWLQITNYGSSHIATELFVYIPDLADTGNPRHAVYEVDTSLYPMGRYHRVVRRLPLWLLLLSVVSGIVVLLALSALLKCCGFFRRKEMEILRRLRSEMEENTANEQLLATSGTGRDLQPINSHLSLVTTPYANGGVGLNGHRKSMGKLDPVLEDDGIVDENNSPTGDGKHGGYVPIPLPTRAPKKRWVPKKNKADLDSINSVISRLRSPKQNHTPVESSKNKYAPGVPPNGMTQNSPGTKRVPENINLSYAVPKNDFTERSSCNPAFELLESPGAEALQPNYTDELLGAYFIPQVPANCGNPFLNNDTSCAVRDGAVSPSSEDRCSPSDIEVANYLHTPPPCYYFPVRDIQQQAAQYLVPMPSYSASNT